jgi:nucleoside-diphosphate-sugar epimerase
VGRHLQAALPDAVVTNTTGRDGALKFSLDDRSTWASLPAAEAVVWTFPAQSVEAVMAFHEAHLRSARRVVVLGTTGSCDVEDGGVATEDTPLKDVPRVRGENLLVSRGASMARLAGIWGPGRDPAGWLRGGMISDVNKRVNLVHVDDIVATIRTLLAHPTATTVLVSDGEPRRWSEHVAHLVEDGRLPADLPWRRGTVEGTRVSNNRLRALMPGHVFRLFTPRQTP